MGWRENFARVARAAVMWAETKPDSSLSVVLMEDVLAMPPADRIALARELLEGTGWSPTEERKACNYWGSACGGRTGLNGQWVCGAPWCPRATTEDTP